jgi:hypothetical protein
MTELQAHFKLPFSLPPEEELFREFPVWLKSAADKGKVVLIVDGLDKLEDKVSFLHFCYCW